MQCSSTQIILNENGTFCKNFYQKEANSISSHRFEVGQFSWSAILHCKHSLSMVPRAKELLDLHIRATNYVVDLPPPLCSLLKTKDTYFSKISCLCSWVSLV